LAFYNTVARERQQVLFLLTWTSDFC